MREMLKKMDELITALGLKYDLPDEELWLTLFAFDFEADVFGYRRNAYFAIEVDCYPRSWDSAFGPIIEPGYCPRCKSLITFKCNRCGRELKYENPVYFWSRKNYDCEVIGEGCFHCGEIFDGEGARCRECGFFLQSRAAC